METRGTLPQLCLFLQNLALDAKPKELVSVCCFACFHSSLKSKHGYSSKCSQFRYLPTSSTIWSCSPGHFACKCCISARCLQIWLQYRENVCITGYRVAGKMFVRSYLAHRANNRMLFLFQGISNYSIIVHNYS